MTQNIFRITLQAVSKIEQFTAELRGPPSRRPPSRLWPRETGEALEKVLNLRVGEVVEVRSAEEILATLDERGAYESLPFMPEMLRFCGRRFRVYRRADKACDTIDWGVLRRMENAVHLDGLRCDGSAHGGCQAGCLIYWKEAWLKRVTPSAAEGAVGPAPAAAPGAPVRTGATLETLSRATEKGELNGKTLYSCQATELVNATAEELPWWLPGQYIQDIRSGNATSRRVVRGLLIGLLNKFQKANRRFAPRFTLIHGGNEYPFLRGRANGGPREERLNLQPGELVEVKSKEEILDTLDEGDKTRGLRFDREMLQYCGRRGRVLRRVEHIIDEKTGRMLTIKADCIIIEGFICTGDYHRMCPRSIFPYWRESWLRRIEGPSQPAAPAQATS